MTEIEDTFRSTDGEVLCRAIAEARDQATAGQTIPLRDVADWLDSWGIPDKRPAPSPQ